MPHVHRFQRPAAFAAWKWFAAATILTFASGALLPAATGSQRWQTEIHAFELADQTNPPPRQANLFVGSSSIRIWKTLASDFPGKRVINRGFGGSQIADSTALADRIIIPCRPRLVLLYAGDNDLAAGRSPEQMLADYRAFVTKIKAALPGTRIAFISIKPSLARWKLVDNIRKANALVKEFTARDRRQAFLDVFTPMLGADGRPRPELFAADGLHLNHRGYEVWVEQIRPVLR